MNTPNCAYYIHTSSMSESYFIYLVEKEYIYYVCGNEFEKRGLKTRHAKLLSYLLIHRHIAIEDTGNYSYKCRLPDGKYFDSKPYKTGPELWRFFGVPDNEIFEKSKSAYTLVLTEKQLSNAPFPVPQKLREILAQNDFEEEDGLECRTMPPNSLMPFSSNPQFVGREDELKSIANSLFANKTTVISQVVAAGIGGIGKTQLACEFIHRHGHEFEGVYWMSFGAPENIPEEIAKCGLQMELFSSEIPLEDRVRQTLLAWQDSNARLLVFDSCEDESLLEKWRPITGGCKILITSRRQRWSKVLGVDTLLLDVFLRRQSIELLCSLCERLDPANRNVNEIAEQLGDLPLALYLAGCFLETYDDIKLDDYLHQLEDLTDHASLQGR